MGLHYFHLEEVLSGIFIEIIDVSRDIEWVLFWVLKIVPPFHLVVALIDYDSFFFHLRHLRPKEGLELREYCFLEAPLSIGTVKDPKCINLLSGRLRHHLEFNP